MTQTSLFLIEASTNGCALKQKLLQSFLRSLQLQLTGEPTSHLYASLLLLQNNENHNSLFRMTVYKSSPRYQTKVLKGIALIFLPSQPPMWFPPINTLGTVRCPVHSARADWIWLPSPVLNNSNELFKKSRSIEQCLSLEIIYNSEQMQKLIVHCL